MSCEQTIKRKKVIRLNFLCNNNILRRILLSLGVFMCCYGIFIMFCINFDISIALFLLAGAIILLSAIFYGRIFKYLFARIVLIAALAAILAECIFAVALAVYGCADDVSYSEDAVIVLGCGIDGDKLSPQLLARLDAAIDYFGKNCDAVIVVSGGRGPQEDVTEAFAMRQYLIKNDIPPEKIIDENASTSTETNLLYSKKLLDEHFGKAYKSAIITGGYHVCRAVDISNEIGLNSSHLHGDTVWYEIPIRYFRETLAIVKRILKNNV